MIEGPGPQERKLRNRLCFKLFGFWSQSVVSERLILSDARQREIIRKWREET